MKSLSQMAWAFLILIYFSKMLSKVPVYSPTSNIRNCLFFQNLINSLSIFLMFAN